MKKMFFALSLLLASALACSLPNNPTCVDNREPFRAFPPPFGKEYNSVRQQIGLPIIPEDWESSYYAGQAAIVWYNPKSVEYREKKVPFYWSKGLECRNGVLISESDTYFGYKDFKCDDTPCRERITITYYYPTDTTEASWEVRQGLERYIPNLDKEGAIQIFAEWGIEYP